MKLAKTLPDLEFGDIYIYLMENPSPYTAQKLKAYGWVNNAVVWEVKNRNIFIIKAKVNVTIPPSTMKCPLLSAIT